LERGASLGVFPCDVSPFELYRGSDQPKTETPASCSITRTRRRRSRRFAPTDLVADSNSPVGLWKNEDATFQIFESDGNLGANIIALKEPTTPEGNQKTDIHNPDPAKRSTPIIGLVFMSGFVRKSETRWEGGTIYDPKSGNTYSCSMELEGPEQIKVRGFIGVSLFGRTEYWSRAKSKSE
jgi:uncharacterized protein (DUF2147 family)